MQVKDLQQFLSKFTEANATGTRQGNAISNAVIFVEKDGQRFAGIHLLIDFWEAKNLTNRITVENALREAAISTNATAINLQLNQYSENGGISGILVLAESHISIHTWPERSFAAIDIFLCGVCNPYDCIAVLKKAFEPGNSTLLERRRGLLP